MACPKKCYGSKSAAKKTMRKLNKTKHFNLKNAYWCDECKCYHNTSMSKKRSRHLTRKLNNGKNKKGPETDSNAA